MAAISVSSMDKGVRMSAVGWLGWILTLLLSISAFGQGTSGTLPDPISTSELQRYAIRLQLSPQQLQAAESLHDQYKREFRMLRDGEISTFLKDMRKLQGNGMMPSRDTMEEFLDRMDKLFKKIELLDNRLFDQLQSILTDEQLAIMPRVRKARQRNRYGEPQMMAFAGARPADISELILDLDLTAEEQAAVDPIAITYESRLTTQMEKLYEATSTTYKDIFEALETHGFNEESLRENPEKAMEMMETMRTVMEEIARKAIDLANGIHQLNATTYPRVRAVISAPQAARLRSAYLHRSYAEIAHTLDWDLSVYDAGREDEQLTEQQRSDLTALRAQADQKLDRLATEGMKMMDEFRESHSVFDMDAEFWQERQKKIQEFTQKVAEAKGEADTGVLALLGQETLNRLRHEGALAAADKTTDVGANEPDQADSDAYSWGADQFLPPKIGAGHLHLYGDLLELDDDQRVLLEALHEDYLEQFAAIERDEIAAITSAQQQLWKFDESGTTTVPPSDEQIDSVYAARQRALDAIRRVDQAFLDNVQEVLAGGQFTEAMERVQLARQCEMFRRGGQETGYGASGGPTDVDLVMLVRRQKLAPDSAKLLAPILLSYQRSALTALANRHARALELQKANERWGAEIQRRQASGESNPFEYMEVQKEIVGDRASNLAAASRVVADLNKATIDRLVDALPPEEAYRLRDAFNLRAYPTIFTDPLAVDQPLRRADQLGDLTPEQRGKLQDLAAEYRPAYAALCDAMVDVVSGPGSVMVMSYQPEDWTAFQAQQDALSKLRFDRTELNGRMLSRLGQILSEEQIKKIGGLPDLAAQGD